MSGLGANAILAVSLAVCKAGAAVNKIPLYKHIANLAGNKKLVLPVPAFIVINGVHDSSRRSFLLQGGHEDGSGSYIMVDFLSLPQAATASQPPDPEESSEGFNEGTLCFLAMSDGISPAVVHYVAWSGELSW
uniref:Enolase N-terminal domain-containing protein n=1 Tax=Fagus sylvatica TaxID=28930 RepID=A0A2N9FAQ6_FAGSY